MKHLRLENLLRRDDRGEGIEVRRFNGQGLLKLRPFV
jgi:hypothetical protein